MRFNHQPQRFVHGGATPKPVIITEIEMAVCDAQGSL